MMRPGWTQQKIVGKSCSVFVPEKRNEHGFALIYLHDLKPRQPAVSMAFQQVAERLGLAIVAPETGHSWWTDHVVPAFDHVMTAEHFLLDHVVPWLGSELGAPVPRVGLFGVGMGGQAALRFSYKHPNVFPVVAGIAPDLDYQLRILEGDEVLFETYGDVESARQDSAILHIHPLNWPRHQFFCCDPDDLAVLEGVDRLRMKLSSIGVPFEIDVQTKAAASANYPDTVAGSVIERLADKLERERLRV